MIQAARIIGTGLATTGLNVQRFYSMSKDKGNYGNIHTLELNGDVYYTVASLNNMSMFVSNLFKLF